MQTRKRTANLIEQQQEDIEYLYSFRILRNYSMMRISENISTYSEYVEEATTDLQKHVTRKDKHRSDKTMPPSKRNEATFDGKEISNYYCCFSIIF